MTNRGDPSRLEQKRRLPQEVGLGDAVCHTDPAARMNTTSRSSESRAQSVRRPLAASVSTAQAQVSARLARRQGDDERPGQGPGCRFDHGASEGARPGEAGARAHTSATPASGFSLAGRQLVDDVLRGLAPRLRHRGDGRQDATGAHRGRWGAGIDAIDKPVRLSKRSRCPPAQVMDPAGTALLTRNSADVGAKVAKTATRHRCVAGAHRRAVARRPSSASSPIARSADDRSPIETRIAARSADATEDRRQRVAPSLPDDKEQLWAQCGRRGCGRPGA